MKRNFIIGLFVLLIVIFSTAFLLYRIVVINTKYPSPEIIKKQMNEEVVVGNGAIIKVTESTMYSIKETMKLFPEYDFQNENMHYSNDEAYMYLIKIGIDNAAGIRMEEDVCNFILQSGAWANGWDMELYSIINEKKLSEEGKEIVYLPFFLFNSQFSKNEWQKIRNREFTLVTSVYPQKTVIELTEK